MAAQLPPTIDIAWHDVSCTAPMRGGANARGAAPQAILKGVSGYARCGSLLAVMGQSGAGKTTMVLELLQLPLLATCVRGSRCTLWHAAM